MPDCIHGKKIVLGQEMSNISTFKVKQLSMTSICFNYGLGNIRREYPEDMVEKIFITSYLFHE